MGNSRARPNVDFHAAFTSGCTNVSNQFLIGFPICCKDQCRARIRRSSPFLLDYACRLEQIAFGRFCGFWWVASGRILQPLLFQVALGACRVVSGDKVRWRRARHDSDPVNWSLFRSSFGVDSRMHKAPVHRIRDPEHGCRQLLEESCIRYRFQRSLRLVEIHGTSRPAVTILAPVVLVRDMSPASAGLSCVHNGKRADTGGKAMAINSATLIGNLGGDPQTRSLPSGNSVANFSLATTERFTDRNGARQERTEWHRIVAFGKLADTERRISRRNGGIVSGRPYWNRASHLAQKTRC